MLTYISFCCFAMALKIKVVTIEQADSAGGLWDIGGSYNDFGVVIPLIQTH